MHKNLNTDKQTREATTGTSEDESNYSSFYSSFLKTDGSSMDGGRNGSDENNSKDPDVSFCRFWFIFDNFWSQLFHLQAMQWDKSQVRPIRPDPAWLNNINVTNELIYRYQIENNNKSVNDVLKEDFETLKDIRQVSSLIQLLRNRNFYNQNLFSNRVISWTSNLVSFT